MMNTTLPLFLSSIKEQFYGKKYSRIALLIFLTIATLSILFLLKPTTPFQENVALAAARPPAIESAGALASNPMDIHSTLQVTASITYSIYMPLVDKPPHPPRQLGNIPKVVGPTDCDGQQCYELTVDCPGISRSAYAMLKVGEPTGPGHAGTILFATGWTGTYLWEDGNASNNRQILDSLRAAGYRTVQMMWYRNWFEAESGYTEGIAQLSCRPATVAQWVYDNLRDTNVSLPFCATGWSNGGSQIAYGMTQYSLAHLYTGVVFEGSPNWSRIDEACLQDDPTYRAVYADNGERNTIDWSYGYIVAKTGPCAKQDASYRDQFQEASLVLGGWSFTYPDTNIAFVIGGDDTTTTAAQAQIYHDLLVKNGSPMVSMTVVPGAGHAVTETTEGAQAVQDALMNVCQPH